MFPTALAALLVAGLLRSPDTARAQLGAAVAAAILFVSPLCALGSAFFTARTGHHLALMLVLAPLIALAMGQATGTRAIPASAATALQAIVLSGHAAARAWTGGCRHPVRRASRYHRLALRTQSPPRVLLGQTRNCRKAFHARSRRFRHPAS